MQIANDDIEEIVENGGYISKLFLNNGKEIDIKENDIVLLVGPNNAGKSQALKDIYEICDTKKPSIVVKDIEIVKHTRACLKIKSCTKQMFCIPVLW
ncbi:ABC transporter ATP-binding protein [Robinsoniella peoriensis]|uniref:ABC transporter ATP-binding protein n=1 Tax=Robinsoniella peoriensis TaxID=180332 RepID=UPI00085CAD0B|nr:ABC transporter ATP-binding protein [Robinsoniella peoriensis]